MIHQEQVGAGQPWPSLRSEDMDKLHGLPWFEPEVTAKIAAMRCRVYEVGISYRGRTYNEGKKIGWRDGVRAMYCIVAYSPPGVRLGVRRAGPLVARITG